jgi:hypothetical protein
MTAMLLFASLLIAQDSPVTAIVRGRVTVDDGSPPPTVITFQRANLVFGLQASVPGTTAQIATTTTNADGSFVLSLSLTGKAGEFAITPSLIPLGYYIKSIQYGTADLLRRR